jgi:hypothetical protein
MSALYLRGSSGSYVVIDVVVFEILFRGDRLKES